LELLLLELALFQTLLQLKLVEAAGVGRAEIVARCAQALLQVQIEGILLLL
jgi:hypothetical protein